MVFYLSHDRLPLQTSPFFHKFLIIMTAWIEHMHMTRLSAAKFRSESETSRDRSLLRWLAGALARELGLEAAEGGPQ